MAEHALLATCGFLLLIEAAFILIFIRIIDQKHARIQSLKEQIAYLENRLLSEPSTLPHNITFNRPKPSAKVQAS